MSIDVDVTALNLRDTITVEEVEFPEGVESARFQPKLTLAILVLEPRKAAADDADEVRRRQPQPMTASDAPAAEGGDAGDKSCIAEGLTARSVSNASHRGPRQSQDPSTQGNRHNVGIHGGRCILADRWWCALAFA